MKSLSVLIVIIGAGGCSSGDNCFSRRDVDPAFAGDPVTMAQAFLDSLDDGQRSKASLPFDAPQKREWTNLPDAVILGRPGLRTGDMTSAQCERAAALLFATTPSAQQLVDVMNADDVLAIANPPNLLRWSTDNYYWVVYGEPSGDAPWAWQLLGHHLGLTATFVDGRMLRVPDFLGIEPLEIERAGQRIRPLDDEARAGLDLANALAVDELERARVDHPPQGILLGAGQDGKFPATPAGLAAAELDDNARELLSDLIDVYLRRLPSPHRETWRAEIDADFDDAHFAWSGDVTDDSRDAYYRVHAPAIWVELSFEQPISGNTGDTPHYHSVMRDPRQDYGQ